MQLSANDSDSPQTLESLLDRIGHGDERAMELLLRKYRPYLRIIAQRAMRSMFATKFDTSDAIQQTCLEAFNAIASFRGSSEAEFNVWIATILRRNMISLMRNHTAQKRDVRREFPLILDDEEEISLQWYLVDSGSSPESKMVRGEAALILAESLSKLGASQRIAVQMRFLEGAKLGEIAEYMEIRTPTVAKLIERGIDALRKELPGELQNLD